MATIKPIEGKSVHQIQSGQVIVDLCSVVKELVENALDASATSIDVRFKNNGIDSIEVQDNGTGIAPEDYETIALKHYTSKLSSYDDLTSLTTFGFRGEALSSLCALSKFSIVTARASDGPKGTKLDFETSGKLKSKSVAASQRGTAVTVEDIFLKLPVRRRELEKNIKREYGKVLGLLHAYACISTGVKFSVSNVPTRGKKMVVFSTKANLTTRENIANVYGAKTLLALIPLGLTLEMNPTTTSVGGARNWGTQGDTETKSVRLSGHISRPVAGEGRQTPDRQMFFVNTRPCALPQVSKAINEVYRSYNITQSPFIFANLEIDTNAYDVNVSPDKRTILLHDQTALLEALKESLIKLFENHDQSVPSAPTPNTKKLPSFRLPARTESPLVLGKEPAVYPSSEQDESHLPHGTLIRRHAEGEYESRESANQAANVDYAARQRRNEAKQGQQEKEVLDAANKVPTQVLRDSEDSLFVNDTFSSESSLPKAVQDFNMRMGIELPAFFGPELPSATSTSEHNTGTQPHTGARASSAATSVDKILSVSSTPQKATPGILPSAFDRMRPKRTPVETAAVTIGNETTIVKLGISNAKKRRIHTPRFSVQGSNVGSSSPSFVSGLSMYAAARSRGSDRSGTESDDDNATDNVLSVPQTKKKPRSLASSMTVTATTTDPDLNDDSESASEGGEDQAVFQTSNDGSDDEYLDESEKKAREEAKINKMIEAVEERAARPTSHYVKRAANALRTRVRKDATLQLVQTLAMSVNQIEKEIRCLNRTMEDFDSTQALADTLEDNALASAEERLSLTVSKSDFTRMRIVGQFNLGFILATRSAGMSSESTSTQTRETKHDELFIIDQHASDEKYNFERLQSQTIVQNQRLVHPKQLDLTAIEEEIILSHPNALTKNGFEISMDTSGDMPVGQRCKLTSLPMSREVTFSLSDLEELIAMLSEYAGSASDVLRPSKVRRMFAMRACRSSIMVGKTLTQKQMEKVVTHMGELDKPWNCPHGRPTMRHLFSMDGFERWDEGQGLTGLGEADELDTDWNAFVARSKEEGLLDIEISDDDDDSGEREEVDEIDASSRVDPRE